MTTRQGAGSGGLYKSWEEGLEIIHPMKQLSSFDLDARINATKICQDLG
jgi:hypothetical protein